MKRYFKIGLGVIIPIAGDSTDNNATYISLESTIPIGSVVSGKWSNYYGTPGSSGTGIAARNGLHMYCETSGPGHSNKYFYLVSPLVTLDSGTLSYYYGAYGATLGTVYLQAEIYG